MFDSPHDWGRFPLGILTTGVLAEAWGQGIVAGLGAQGNLTEFYLNEILHWGVPTASGVYNPPVFGEIDGISWDLCSVQTDWIKNKFLQWREVVAIYPKQWNSQCRTMWCAPKRPFKVNKWSLTSGLKVSYFQKSPWNLEKVNIFDRKVFAKLARSWACALRTSLSPWTLGAWQCVAVRASLASCALRKIAICGVAAPHIKPVRSCKSQANIKQNIKQT